MRIYMPSCPGTVVWPVAFSKCLLIQPNILWANMENYLLDILLLLNQFATFAKADDCNSPFFLPLIGSFRSRWRVFPITLNAADPK